MRKYFIVIIHLHFSFLSLLADESNSNAKKHHLIIGYEKLSHSKTFKKKSDKKLLYRIIEITNFTLKDKVWHISTVAKSKGTVPMRVRIFNNITIKDLKSKVSDYKNINTIIFKEKSENAVPKNLIKEISKFFLNCNIIFEIKTEVK